MTATRWRKAVGLIVGLALACGAGYARPLVLDPDRLDDPLTVSGGLHDRLDTDRFSTRLERVELARSLRVEGNGSCTR